jgi:biotin carboxylase
VTGQFDDVTGHLPDVTGQSTRVTGQFGSSVRPPRVLLLMRTRTYRARAFLEAASRLDLRVTVGTERAHVLASLTPGTMLALDFDHPRAAREQVLEFAERYPIDAVVGVDDDTTVLAAQAAEALGLPHNTVDSVKAARYKDVMRLALSETDLLAPRFRLVGIDTNPEQVAAGLEYPCVVKPLSLSASRGVIRADDPPGFVSAFREAVSVLAEAAIPPDDPAARQLLVEDFIPGKEFALEGLLVDGRLHTLTLFDKPDPLDGPYFEETIYTTPSRLPPQHQAAVTEAAQRAALALGLREGPIHAEMRLNERGPWVVEVAARSIGGLCSRTLRFEEGMSLEEIILRQATRRDLGSLTRERRPAGVMMIPVPRTGRLRDVRGRAEAERVPGIESVDITVPCGEWVAPPPRGTRYLGFIFARAESPQAVERALRQAHARLEFEID